MALRLDLVLAASAMTLLGCAGGLPHSTRAGVYTAEQATQGKDVYAAVCISCHAGMGNHTGPVFRARWDGHDLHEMYRYISESMPKNAPETLSADEYLSVMAYLLQMNGMPAGATPLSTDTLALKAITVDLAPPKR